jgi:succinate dehydrogenase/fumarate reductase flavoprotein subunit
MWWESNIRGFFPVGEVNGTHGIYRPGGSALNSGQCGGMRAAMLIAGERTKPPCEAAGACIELIQNINNIVSDSEISAVSNIAETRKEIGETMSRYAAHIRDAENIERSIKITKEKYLNYWETVKLKNIAELPFALQNRDLLIAQYVYLSAMLDCIKQGGASEHMIQEILLIDGETQITWRKRRTIPDAPRWFESVWNEYAKTHSK